MRVPPSFALLYNHPHNLESLCRVAPGSRAVLLRFHDRLQVNHLLAGPDANFRPQPSRIARGPALAQNQQVSQLVLVQREI